MLQRVIFLFFIIQVSLSQNAEKLVDKGKTFLNQEKLDKAINSFNKAIEIDNKLDEAFFYRAYIKTLLKNYEGAIKDYSTVLELKPEDEVSYFNRGRIRYILNDDEKALADFKAAIKIDIKFNEAYLDMARVYIRMKDLNSAIDTYSKLIDFGSEYALAYYNRGLINYRLGKKEEACADAKKAKNFGVELLLGSKSIDMLIENSCPDSDDYETVDEYNFSIIEEVPIWPGCENVPRSERRNCFQMKMQQHISRNFRYPEIAQKKGIQGRVFIQFVIDIDGSVTSIRTKGPDIALEMAAKRIISLVPRLKPGIQKGKPVRVPFSIPITFKLQ